MKNNKGFTLVELLVTIAILSLVMVEIFSMMQNSSKLYMNGTYEVALQTEAQQIIQQMENLLIDANSSVSANYDASVSSDIIVVSNNDARYTIALKKDDPNVPYGDLLMTKEDFVGGTTVTDLPMAENVESISLNMVNYTASSFVTLNIKLQNEEYNYAVAKDIYLRNDVGTGGNNPLNNTNNTFDYELDVLRYKTYSLTALFDPEGVGYSYEFEDGSTHNGDYYIGNSPSYDLKCTSTLNLSNDLSSSYIIVAKDPVSGADAFKIRVQTEKIQIGADGYGLCYLPVDSTYTVSSYIDVKGISVYDATAVEIKFCFSDMGAAGETVLSNSPTSVAHTVGDYFRFDNMALGANPGDNCVVIQADQIQDVSNYYNYIVAGNTAQVVVTYEFPGGRPDLVVRAYCFPSATTPGSMMSTTVANAFWSSCH